MTKRTIIALTGPAGCGKDTVADYLCHEHGFERFAFADAVKREAAAAFGVSVEMFNCRATKEKPFESLRLSFCRDFRFVATVLQLEVGMQNGTEDDIEAALSKPRSPRQIMQRWGTEYRKQQYGAGYWITALVEQLALTDTPVVVTDCRFDDEAEFLRGLGADVWQLIRPDAHPVSDHASEKPISAHRVNWLIDNVGTIPALYLHIEHALASMDRAMRCAA